MASRHLPAITTSLGLLATPVVSILVAALWLQELPTADVLAAMALILSGIAIGATDHSRGTSEGASEGRASEARARRSANPTP